MTVDKPAGLHKKIRVERLRFKIISRGEEIASFLNGCDRDLCLDALQERYDDCNFESMDEE